MAMSPFGIACDDTSELPVIAHERALDDALRIFDDEIFSPVTWDAIHQENEEKNIDKYTVDEVLRNIDAEEYSDGASNPTLMEVQDEILRERALDEALQFFDTEDYSNEASDPFLMKVQNEDENNLCVSSESMIGEPRDKILREFALDEALQIIDGEESSFLSLDSISGRNDAEGDESLYVSLDSITLENDIECDESLYMNLDSISLRNDAEGGESLYESLDSITLGNEAEVPETHSDPHDQSLEETDDRRKQMTPALSDVSEEGKLSSFQKKNNEVLIDSPEQPQIQTSDEIASRKTQSAVSHSSQGKVPPCMTNKTKHLGNKKKVMKEYSLDEALRIIDDDKSSNSCSDSISLGKEDETSRWDGYVKQVPTWLAPSIHCWRSHVRFPCPSPLRPCQSYYDHSSKEDEEASCVSLDSICLGTDSPVFKQNRSEKNHFTEKGKWEASEVGKMQAAQKNISFKSNLSWGQKKISDPRIDGDQLMSSESDLTSHENGKIHAGKKDISCRIKLSAIHKKISKPSMEQYAQLMKETNVRISREKGKIQTVPKNLPCKTNVSSSQKKEAGTAEMAVASITGLQGTRGWNADAENRMCTDCNEHFKSVARTPKPTCDHPFRCEFCSKTFSDSDLLKSHERIHAGDVCRARLEQDRSGGPRGGDVFRNTFTNVEASRAQSQHRCDHCGERFADRHLLTVHSSIHTGERPSKCEFCPKRFRAPDQSLDLTGEKPLSSHEQSDVPKVHKFTDAVEKPFECEVCHKKFRLSNHLKCHELVHTAVKLVKCDVCFKIFTNVSNLKSHQRIHKRVKLCEARNPSSGDSRIQKRTHSSGKRYTCDVCQKIFCNLGNLKVHHKTHTDVKPHVCEVCHRSFGVAGHLKRHKSIHSEQKGENIEGK